MRRVFRVAVVEPSMIIGERMRSLFAGSEYEVVYVAESMRGLVEHLSQLSVDVVVVSSQVASSMSQGVRYQFPELQGYGVGTFVFNCV